MMRRSLQSSVHMKNSMTMQRNALLNMQMMRHFAVIRKFTKTHEWIELDDATGIATIGITDHAQKELGDIVHVDLPDVGQSFSANDAISCVESVKTAADIYQMVDGEVTEVNELLADEPNAVNTDAEGKGWLMKVKLVDQTQMDDLLTGDDYDQIK